MIEEALLLEIAHRAPDRRRRHAKPEPAGDGIRARGLGGLYISLDDRLENPALALSQLGGRHNSKRSNDFKNLSTRMRGSRGEAIPRVSSGSLPRRAPPSPPASIASPPRDRSLKRRSPWWCEDRDTHSLRRDFPASEAPILL